MTFDVPTLSSDQSTVLSLPTMTPPTPAHGHTFSMGDQVPITFHFSVNSNVIAFDVVIPTTCITEDCQQALAWAFAVANPGQSWTRVSSGPHVPWGAWLPTYPSGGRGPLSLKGSHCGTARDGSPGWRGRRLSTPRAVR